jgi:hypothetical protein
MSSSNIDPVAASLGMPYGVSMGGGTAMGGGMPFVGGMMPGMGMGMPAYTAGAAPSAPLPPGVSSASANTESSPYGPSEDNFNGKFLSSDPNEKKKRDTRNFFLAAGVAVSAVMLLAFTHGRSGKTPLKAMEENDLLREKNLKEHLENKENREELSLQKRKNETLESNFKRLKSHNEFYTTRIAAQETEIASLKGARQRAKSAFDNVEPFKRAKFLIEEGQVPRNVAELERAVNIKIPTSTTKSSETKKSATEFFRSVVQKGDPKTKSLIADIGQHDAYLPASILGAFDHTSSEQRQQILSTLLSERNLASKINYPQYDMDVIKAHKDLIVKNGDSLPIDFTKQTPIEEQNIESFLKYHGEVLENLGHKDAKTEMNNLIAGLPKTKNG